jgi:hypothetical protein
VKSNSLVLLQDVTKQLPSLFKKTANPLLLEQAIWAQNQGEPSAAIDWDRFSRWVEEGSLKTAVTAVNNVLGAATEGRVKNNTAHVYRSVKL